MNELIGTLRLPHRKFVTCAKGNGPLKIKLNFRVFMNGQHQLMCHEELHQNWKDLADAIKHCIRRKISLVEISNIQLSSEILEMLLPSLTETVNRHPMPSLVFNSNSLGKYEVSRLANFVRMNNGLRSLELSGNAMNNLTAISELSEAISFNSSMKCLKLEKCFLGQSTSVMHAIIPSFSNLTSCYLSGNHIGSEGAILLAKMIADNPPLQELYLNDNELYDADMGPVADSLKLNTNLRKFLTLDGEDTLLSALVNVDNIITIFNSNHTCGVFLKQSGNSRIG
jgi:Ran GTPase-activating protein (RanGAP) involved in mRNA processing and transport